MEPKKHNNKWNRFFAVFFIIFSIIYGISPIDLAPDIIPILGWSDDILLNLLAIINLYLQWKKNNKKKE